MKLERRFQVTETFGAMLRRERTAKGLTLRAIAAAAGVSPAYISDLEQDRRHPPQEAIARQIAATIGLDPEAFVRRASWGRVPRIYRERITTLEKALGFAASVIKSGESWTATCEDVIGGALRHEK